MPLPTPKTLQGKLTLATVSLLVVILLLVALAISYLINAWIVDEAQQKVRQDMNSAQAEYQHALESLQQIVRFSAQLTSGETGYSLAAKLAEVRRNEKLDFLSLAGTGGDVRLRAGRILDEPQTIPAELYHIYQKSLAGQELTSSLILSPFSLQHEDAALTGMARITVQSAPERIEERGLALIAMTPWMNSEGNIAGVLYGGILLNNNLALVDRLRQIIYGDTTFKGVQTGSATIFLDDLRVATTIRLPNGERAMGTAVSTEVAEAVLVEGRPWFARAKVVDQWYLTAYEPILNPAGRPIGALYVGLLEAPFTALKVRVLQIQIIVFGLLCIAGYIVARGVFKRLAKPLLRLEIAAEKVAAGERDIDPVPITDDEIGHLCDAFNRMTQSLTDREQELHVLNRELEDKVSERTRQLEERSMKLIATREELLKAEQLASLGTLAAGVAHEINNPAAIIRGNAEILQMELQSNGADEEEVREILKQTERIAAITGNMLDMARDQRLNCDAIDCNQLLTEIIEQASHHVDMGSVEVICNFAVHLPKVESDSDRLRQIFTNIIINALQALAGRGSLTVATTFDDSMIIVSISDNGPGIQEDILDKIFDPFFSTKSTGSGLGLAISYGLIKALGGDIEAVSHHGNGTQFTIRIPRHQGYC